MLSDIATHSEDILKVIATVASIVGTVVAIVGGIWSIRKTKAEIAALERRAQAVADAGAVVSILSDPRGGLVLLIAMDFVIASIVTMLTRYALDVIVAPFSGVLRDWIYAFLQGIIIAIFFWPIVGKARRLKTLVTGV